MTTWRDFWIGTFFAILCITWFVSVIIAIAARVSISGDQMTDYAICILAIIIFWSAYVFYRKGHK